MQSAKYVLGESFCPPFPLIKIAETETDTTKVMRVYTHANVTYATARAKKKGAEARYLRE